MFRTIFSSSALYSSILVVVISTLTPTKAHAFDLQSIPLLVSIINAIFPPPSPPKPIVVTRPTPITLNVPTTQVWTIPQPNIETTYLNTQRQRVYYVYTPTHPVVSKQVPTAYVQQPLQIPLTWVESVTPPTPKWSNLSPVLHPQTVPVAPDLPGINNNTTQVAQLPANNLAQNTTSSQYYRWPVPTNASGTKNYVNSPYGLRDRDNFVRGCSDGTAPKSHCGIRMHNGIDIKVPHGTPVESMSSGKVVWVDPYCKHPDARLVVNRNPNTTQPRGGCTVSVFNNKGEMITYQHLSDAGGLKIGDEVRAGDIIGKVGNSGASSGPHLDVVVCEISEEKIKAAQASRRSLSRCAPNGGKTINPLDRMDPNDPRAQSARAREGVSKEYIKCMGEAGASMKAVEKCRSTFEAKNNEIEREKQQANTSNANVVQQKPLTGAYNAKRF